MSEELKPCPFCGGEARLDQLGSLMNGDWQTSCDRCEILIQKHEKDVVISLWNTRADTTHDK